MTARVVVDQSETAIHGVWKVSAHAFDTYSPHELTAFPNSPEQRVGQHRGKWIRAATD